ncbi:MAG: YdcH family protein [Sphingomonadales bacterium]|jgi:hypothetical protein|nr:YdcH family protein [Sphingomonadales bacterium]
MSMTVFRLMQIHQKLDAQISAEQRNRLPDVIRIGTLKKMKLAVKDRLAKLGMGRRNPVAA